MTYRKSRMVLEDMPIRPDPFLLQARRICLAQVAEVTLEPVRIFGTRQVLQGRAIREDTAARKNVQHVRDRHSKQSQHRDEEGVKDGDEPASPELDGKEITGRHGEHEIVILQLCDGGEALNRVGFTTTTTTTDSPCLF